MLPTLDAHAHLDPSRNEDELCACGAVLAMSLSLDAAERALHRSDPLICWGVGCHPRFPRFQERFDAKRFQILAEKAGFIGEIGLDAGSRVPLELQLKTFRRVLEIVSDMPRLVSIHSYQATGLVLNELQRCTVTTPILHWWTGSAAETERAVALGCYF